jgi:hypothetical protein
LNQFSTVESAQNPASTLTGTDSGQFWADSCLPACTLLLTYFVYTSALHHTRTFSMPRTSERDEAAEFVILAMMMEFMVEDERNNRARRRLDDIDERLYLIREQR